MNCHSATPLDDVQLLAYLDGAAVPEIIAHVEGCPACHARADALARAQEELRANLFRISCPSPADLRDLHFDLLEPAQADSIAAHIECCPHCTRELFVDYIEHGDNPALQTADESSRLPAAAQEMLAQGRGLAQRVKLAVATLMDTGMTPAYALRGSFAGGAAPTYAHMYQVDDSMVSLVIHPDHDLPNHMAIEGQALTTDLPPNAPAIQVHLWQAERLAGLCILDAAGDFAIPRLAPGRYELILSSARYKIKIPDFQVDLPEPSGV